VWLGFDVPQPYSGLIRCALLVLAACGLGTLRVVAAHANAAVVTFAAICTGLALLVLCVGILKARTALADLARLAETDAVAVWSYTDGDLDRILARRRQDDRKSVLASAALAGVGFLLGLIGGAGSGHVGIGVAVGLGLAAFMCGIGSLGAVLERFVYSYPHVSPRPRVVLTGEGIYQPGARDWYTDLTGAHCSIRHEDDGHVLHFSKLAGAGRTSFWVAVPRGREVEAEHVRYRLSQIPRR